MTATHSRVGDDDEDKEEEEEEAEKEKEEVRERRCVLFPVRLRRACFGARTSEEGVCGDYKYLRLPVYDCVCWKPETEKHALFYHLNFFRVHGF